jgi:hypothetical protein
MAKTDRIVRMQEAEIARLKARNAELEAQLALRPAAAPKPITIDAPSEAPARNGRAGRVENAHC